MRKLLKIPWDLRGCWSFNAFPKFLRKKLGESAREDRGIFGGRGGRNNAK